MIYHHTLSQSALPDQTASPRAEIIHGNVFYYLSFSGILIIYSLQCIRITHNSPDPGIRISAMLKADDRLHIITHIEISKWTLCIVNKGSPIAVFFMGRPQICLQPSFALLIKFLLTDLRCATWG